ncbi:MAG: DUF6062 family protein [Eubacterium sp.]|jgi:hypothetical protein|nr:DUF6062 family protein [Eubacterium sp.]
MRESILTIPINEVFEPKTGCPLCRMRDIVEGHVCEYIMGAAMMEPDIRSETNELGFCFDHYEQLLKQNNRLSLALMLDSYLEINKDKFFSFKKSNQKKLLFGKTKESPADTCFVCSKTDWGIRHMCETIFNLFKSESEFKALFYAQEYFCLPHYRFLLEISEASLNKNDFLEFNAALNEVTRRYIISLNSDVHDFCQSFDYRNAGKLRQDGMERIKNSVHRAIEFLTGRKA